MKQFNTVYIVEHLQRLAVFNFDYQWQPQVFYFKYEQARQYIRDAKKYSRANCGMYRIGKFVRT